MAWGAACGPRRPDRHGAESWSSELPCHECLGSARRRRVGPGSPSRPAVSYGRAADPNREPLGFKRQGARGRRLLRTRRGEQS